MKIYAPDIAAVMRLRKEESVLKERIRNGEDLGQELEDIQDEILSYAAEEEGE